MHNPAGIRVGEFIFRETAYGVVKRLRFFVEHIEAERTRLKVSREEMRVLDVGCGTGTYVTIPLAAMGYKVVGIDADENSIQRARENAATAGVRDLELSSSLLQEWEGPPFHIIICSEVLEHQAKPEDLLQAIRCALVEKGLLLVTVPNGYGYYELESFITRIVPFLPAVADRLERYLVRTVGTPALRRRHKIEYGGEDSDRDRWRNATEQSSLAADEKHYQAFTPSRIRRLLTSQDFEICAFRNNTFLAGNAWNALIRSLDVVLYWNGRVADFLPRLVSSDWMIASRRTTVPGTDRHD